MWPMTQARLCCSGSKGIDKEGCQAGPGSPRQEWNGEQIPPVKIQRHDVCGGPRYGVGGTASPRHETQARDGSRSRNIYSTPTLPIHIVLCWPRTEQWLSVNLNVSPLTGPLLLQGLRTNLSLFHLTAITHLMVAMSVPSLQHSKSPGKVPPVPSTAPHETISSHCTVLLPLRGPNFRGSGFPSNCKAQLSYPAGESVPC